MGALGNRGWGAVDARMPSKLAQFADSTLCFTCILYQNAIEYAIFRLKKLKKFLRRELS